VFVNGALRAIRHMTLNTQGRDFYIGARTDNWAFFRGDIDDVRVYNKNLSQNDVTSLYKYEQYSTYPLAGAATKSPFDPATAANWSAGGTEWRVDTTVTHDGVDSVKAQTTDGQSTFREYTVTGPAVVDFWWRVSSEKNFDTFSYSLNGVNQETISGEVDWTYRTVTLPEGTHTIRWTYSKDGSDGIGHDAGWIDDFAVYPAKPTLRVSDGTTDLNGAVTVDFGDADIGSAGFTKSLTFVNEGYVPQEVELSLPASSPFTFEDGAFTYSTLLGRGESVAVPIYLATQSTGTKTTALTITAPDSTVAPPQITLTGDVLGPVVGVFVGSTPLTSGQTVDMGLAPKTLEFTVRNNGNTGDLTPHVSATGNFQIVQQPSASVAPQASTTFKVLAQSGIFGPQTGSVVVTSNDGFTPTFTIVLTSKAFLEIGSGISEGTVATSGTGGASGWDFASTQLPSGSTGQAIKTGVTPSNGGSVLEFTSQTAGLISWSWKVSAQQDFDWLLCEVDGQEVAGISTKSGVWQTQVVQVPTGANVRWVYRKDASGSAGEDAGYLADVVFSSFTANQSFSQWAQTNGVTDPQQRMPKSGMQAMFGWLGGFRVDGDAIPDIIVAQGRLTYRYPVSKTADGTQQILFSGDMSSWTTRRISQRIVSEDADRVVIEATAPSGTKGFFKLGAQPPPLIEVETVPVGDAGNAADTNGFGSVSYEYRIGKYEVTIAQYTAFLNSVAKSDPYGLYSTALNANYNINVTGIARSGGGTPTDPYSYLPIGNSSRPIAYVSWFDAARFANWMHNGAIDGADTENGAYTLSGRTNGDAVARNSNAKWWIPTKNEWYKAAYFKGGSAIAGYWRYPTQSDSAPSNLTGGAINQANIRKDNVYCVTQSSEYSQLQNYLTEVGSFSNSSSAYGTFDQGGNLHEWNDLTASIGPKRGYLGGYWDRGEFFLSSAFVGDDDAAPNAKNDNIGFRVARNAED
jgi:formylglycine-generating enzyme